MRRFTSLLVVLAIVASAGAVVGPAGAAELPAWTRVLTVEGGIVDVSAGAVLFGSGTEIRHLDRATGVETLVTSTAVSGGYSRLTPQGALVTLEAPGGFPAGRLRHWTPAGSTDLGTMVFADDQPFVHDWPVASAGNWVAWTRQRNPDGTGGGLFLRNLASGAQRLISSTLVAEIDVASDGTVAFARAGHVFRDRGGVVVQVTPAGPATEVHGPMTDGTAVMYSRFVPVAEPDTGLSSLLVSSGSGAGETVLAGPHQCRLVPLGSGCEWISGFPEPGRDYTIAPGVKAWTDIGLWQRVGTAPAREVFEGWTSIIGVGPGGQVAFHHLLGLSGEIIIADDPYLVGIDGTVVPVHRPSEAAIGWAGDQPIAYRGGDLYGLELDDTSGPQLRYQPDDATAQAGSSVEFRAEIGGYPQPLIRWERSVDGVRFDPVPPVFPVQERDLSILSVQSGAGAYRWFRAKATGPGGTVTTRAAKLTVGLTVAVPGSGEGPEGDTGGSVVEVPVTLTPTNVPVYLDWRTVEVPGLADQATPGTDYTPSSGRLVIPTYSSSGAVAIPVLGDSVVEAHERIIIAFSNPSGATIGGFYGLGVATILDDDVPRVTVGTGSALEGNALRVPLTLNHPGTSTVTVRWATVLAADHPGQATPGADYTTGSGTVTFAPGQTQSELLIPTIEDALAEPPEGFFVLIDAAQGANIEGWGVGGGLIFDDD